MGDLLGKQNDRLPWPDFIRGVCIVLVVSAHVSVQHLAHLDINPTIATAWIWINKGFAPMRLPLFFLISGFLAANAVQRTWKVSLSKSVANWYYLYALWVIPLSLLYAWLDTSMVYGRIVSLTDALVALLVPSSSLWYLYALALYFIVARALRDLPPIPVVAVAALACSTIATYGGVAVVASVGQYLVFFLIGAYFKQQVLGIAESGKVLWPTVAYCLALAVYVFGLQSLPGTRTVCGLVGAWFGLAVLSKLHRRLSLLARASGFLGRQTLPIYILHYPLLAAAGPFLSSWTAKAPDAVVAIYPLLLTAALIIVPLILRNGLTRVGLVWLFERPTRSVQSSHQL